MNSSRRNAEEALKAMKKAVKNVYDKNCKLKQAVAVEKNKQVKVFVPKK